MGSSVGIAILSDDLSGVVDTIGRGVECAGQVEREVAAAAVEEPVLRTIGSHVPPHDFPGIVDAIGFRIRCTRYVEGFVTATDIKETMVGTVPIFVLPHDISESVDAIGVGTGKWVVHAKRREAVPTQQEARGSDDLTGSVDAIGLRPVAQTG